MSTPRSPSLARTLDHGAIASLLAEHYPVVHRVAYGLTGREDVGRGVVRRVMWRGMHQLDKWVDEGQAQGWFLHHTILTARRASKHPPDPRRDLLLTRSSQSTDPGYQAFVRGVRALPHQQTEAFLLHHAEALNPRYLGIAMDCSTGAAGTHLRAADQAMKTFSAEHFDAFVTGMRQAYRTLSPKQEIALPMARRFVRRYVWPRRAARLVGWLLTLTLIAGLAWLGWWLHRVMEV